MNKILKKIVAREILILILMGSACYFLFSFVNDKISIPFPKYKLEFSSGETYTIDIYPDIYASTDMKSLTEEFFAPKQKVVEKRINEFIKRQNIKSALKKAEFINQKQLSRNKALIDLLRLNLFIKIFAVYFILLLGRFIVWEVKALNEPGA